MWAAFGYFWDKKLSADFRDQVRQILLHALREHNLGLLFAVFFDRIFSTTPTSRPSFTRSVFASWVILAILLGSWASYAPHRFFGTWSHVESVAYGLPTWPLIASVFCFAVAINVVGDFFSMWETRFIVGRIATSPGQFLIVWLLLDLIATITIYAASYVLGISIMILLYSLVFDDMTWLAAKIFFDHYLFSVLDQLVIQRGLLFCPPPSDVDLFVIFFYTTLFTSVWIWVFMLGIKLWPICRKLSWILDVENYPVGSAMTIGGVLIGFLVTISLFTWQIFEAGSCLRNELP